MVNENEFINAIKKLSEIEDEKILYSLSKYFESKANCARNLREFLEVLEKEHI